MLLYQTEIDKNKTGSFKLKVKWVGNGVYHKENLTTLFSKVIHQNYILNICLIPTIFNIIVWLRKNCCGSGK